MGPEETEEYIINSVKKAKKRISKKKNSDSKIKSPPIPS
jgi:hypothetical protein